MSAIRTLARSFSGGEVTPEFWGRIDDPGFQTGLALQRNFYSLPHGPAVNRAGFGFVHETKASAKKAVVRPFTYSITQTMVLEFGDFYVRFHTIGAVLLQGAPAAYNAATAYTPGDLVSSGGVNYVCIANTTGNAPPNATYWYAQPATGEYEIPSQYAVADVFDLHFAQSGDVLTITHPNYPVTELRRGGGTKWYFQAVSFISALSPPTAPAAAATVNTAGGTSAMGYVVTHVLGADESLPTAAANCTNNLDGYGNYNTITWTAAAGATSQSRYNVYKLSGGIYGFVGQSSTTSFKDDNIAADISYCPPENVNPFPGANEYPGAVTYYEQRRCLAGSLNKPSNFWGTRAGTESNMGYSIPSRADDSIQFRIAALKNQTIRHMVPLLDLLLLTTAGVWRVMGSPFAIGNFSLKQQSSVGANNVTPLVCDTHVLYATARGGHVRETGYSNESGGFVTSDTSLRAPHLFDGLTIVDMAYAEAPYPIAWFVSSNGQLLSLTYIPEQNIRSWSRHDTDGLFESICVVAEGNEDILYAVVNRTIGGVTKRYVERMATRRFATQADAFFVDCGATYSGVPATQITGLNWLEGKTVSILADGAVHPQQVVTGGKVNLQAAASKAQIGLPITSDLQTLPLAFEVQGFGQGRQKNVNQVWLRVAQSLGIKAGPSFDKLKEFPARTTEPFGSPPGLQTKEVNIVLNPSWKDAGQVCIRQTDPLPLTVVSLELEVEVA